MTPEEEEEKEETSEEKVYSKSLKVGTLNVQVEITSEDPEDSLEKMIKNAVGIIDKYN